MIQLEFPAASRRASLRDEVNREYFAFLDQLDQPLSDLGRRRGTFDGRSGSMPLAGIMSLNPLIVAAPWLFWGAFPIRDDQMAVIAGAGAYLGAAYAILDHFHDDQTEQPLLAKRLQAAFHNRAKELLAAQIEASAPFWARMEKLWQELLETLAEERRMFSRHTLVSRSAFFSVSAAKAIPLIITVAALSHTDDRADVLDPAERSLRLVGPAVQLWHDVGDWPKDYRARQLTYFLSEALAQLYPDLQKNSATTLSAYLSGTGWPAESQLRRIISEKKLYARYWSESQHWLEESRSQALPININTWNDYLQQWQEQVQSHIYSITNPDDPRSMPLTFLQILKRIAASERQ